MYDIKNLQNCNDVIERTWMSEAKQAKEEALAG
jgi:hypothetical protein